MTVGDASAPDPAPGWRKASASGLAGCVELTRQTRILIRDSKHPDGPVLEYTREEWIAFLDGAKKGEFDDLL
jgi:hypothetical protein